MKKVIFLIFLLYSFSFSYQASYSQSGWTVVNTGINLNKMYFINQNVGWLNNNTNIFRTSNGGLNWFQTSASFNGINDFLFVNENTGFAIGRISTVLRIYKTTDSGSSWLFDHNPQGFSYMYFFDENTGYYSANQQLRKTTNCGSNWDIGYMVPFDLVLIQFTSSMTGYASNLPNLYKTINGGQNWTSIKTLNNGLSVINFINDYTGYIFKNGENIYKTTSGGIFWTNVNTPSGINSIHFVNENKGWACGNIGVVYQTTNGGTNWNFQYSNTLNHLYHIQFLNENTGFIYGNGYSSFIKTTTGGTIGINTISTEIPVNYSLLQNFPNPFNPSTNIKFAIPKSSDVRIAVYDISGKELELLVNEQLQAGTYQTEWNGSNYSSGVYFYKMTAETFSNTKKMILIK